MTDTVNLRTDKLGYTILC